MGRYNFTALRVRQRAIKSFEVGQRAAPVWLDVTGEIPPAQVFIRKQPQEQFLIRQRVKTVSPPSSAGANAPRFSDGSATPSSSSTPPQTRVEVTSQRIRGRTTKKSKLFKPIEIRYEEDELRQKFYKDHPWELARPRIVLENDGRDSERLDWSTGIEQHQHGKKLDGESVIQRQLWLLQNVPNISQSQSYDIARREFYSARQQEDIERRIAGEEARYVGAQFAPDVVTWGMALEDQTYDDWERWARQQVLEREQKRAAFTGENANAPVELAEVEDEDSESAAVEGGQEGQSPTEQIVGNQFTARREERNVRLPGAR